MLVMSSCYVSTSPVTRVQRFDNDTFALCVTYKIAVPDINANVTDLAWRANTEHHEIANGQFTFTRHSGPETRLRRGTPRNIFTVFLENELRERGAIKYQVCRVFRTITVSNSAYVGFSGIYKFVTVSGINFC